MIYVYKSTYIWCIYMCTYIGVQASTTLILNQNLQKYRSVALFTSYFAKSKKMCKYKNHIFVGSFLYEKLYVPVHVGIILLAYCFFNTVHKLNRKKLTLISSLSLILSKLCVLEASFTKLVSQFVNVYINRRLSNILKQLCILHR